jgi:N-acetylneuraminate synthase
MREVAVGGRLIGDGQPCFIIAEAGSNHNGSLEQAKRLIDVAADAGADAVKFQVFRAARLYPKSAGMSDYLKVAKPIYEIIAEMEMPYAWIPELAAYCEEREILFLASAFDEESVDMLDPHVPAFKIASYEVTHIRLVRHIAKKKKPVIVSTGTADIEEVREMVEEFRRTGNDQLMLMQSTASYPAPLESLNVRAVQTLKRAFGVPAGLSDHSRDPLVGPLSAVALGANLVEKHFTLNNELPGPDHRFALEPAELRLMVQKVREVERALGTGEKVAQQVETELRAFARRSIFAARDIEVGETLTPDSVVVLRRGKLGAGLSPKHYECVLGRKASRRIPKDSPIREADLDSPLLPAVTLRRATEEDQCLLWEWRNESEVRAQSFETEPIPWERHMDWFRAKLQDPNYFIYVVLNGQEEPIGQVRFDVRLDGAAEVSVSLAKEQRGRGYGRVAIQRACAHLIHTVPVAQFVAHVRPQNVASVRAFGKAGFVEQGNEVIKGCQALRMILKVTSPVPHEG